MEKLIEYKEMREAIQRVIEYEEMREATQRVRELHKVSDDAVLGFLWYCTECSNLEDRSYRVYPCQTIKSLDGEK